MWVFNYISPHHGCQKVPVTYFQKSVIFTCICNASKSLTSLTYVYILKENKMSMQKTTQPALGTEIFPTK